MESRILILGASCFFSDAYNYARNNNIYTVAVDQRDAEFAICKGLASVSYSASTRDIDALLMIAEKEKINGIYAGASETNMPTAIQLAEKLHIPFYCGKKQWAIGTNKRLFKEMCIRHNVPVTKAFEVSEDDFIEKSDALNYPVVTKPVDNNGSTGITICYNSKEFINGYKKAVNNSATRDVLVEEYMPYDSVIIHYTMMNGKGFFCGISDKKSRKIQDNGAPVMALQFFPSLTQQRYISELNQQVIRMFETEGFANGPIWVEAFFDGQNFIFNEMGYRFGGSMTYHAVKYLTGIDQISLLMNQTENDIKEIQYHWPNNEKTYCIVPIHIKPGLICEIEGCDEVENMDFVYAVSLCHVKGDLIEATGTVSQVFCYLHLLLNDREEVNKVVKKVLDKMHALNELQDNLLFYGGGRISKVVLCLSSCSIDDEYEVVA